MRKLAIIGLLGVGLTACVSHGGGELVSHQNGMESQRVSAIRGGDVDPDDSQRICKSTPITGSRAVKRVCHTRAEWAAMRRNGEEAVRTTQQRATGHFENEGLRAGGNGTGGG